MKIAFSTGRPAHVVLPANLLTQRGMDVTIYTAAYRSRFRQLLPGVKLRWIPQLVPSFHFLTGVQLPRPFQRVDTAIYDHVVGLRMEPCEIFWGWASGALTAGRAARRSGASFVLDRACPHVDVQQALILGECQRLSVAYHPEPRWFRDRQIAEYEEADVILVPSKYSRRSFPAKMQSKVLVAPLFGRVPSVETIEAVDTSRFAAAGGTGTNDRPYTLGAVGGQLLRKGFHYLLQAWEKIKLPHAKLLLRTDARLDSSPVLRDLLRRLPNVEIVRYLDNMSDFYRRCDTFVLPTIDDGFGMVLLEAMAHGLPTITTTHCGASELFAADEDLLIVPAQDADALAGAIESLYSSTELRRRLAENGRCAVQALESNGQYSLYTHTLDELIQRVLPQQKQARSAWHSMS